ncbi:helix-turn-helix domain-containing protein [Rhodococcus pyridinivorans]|uniref:helix-turn-helix domain-containing protein n=1 Tax=Rhodococcus pyridinivorans TaxID=103816 RepID=UPI001E53C491|nr:helix-turn-helix transcriptional regulator [Rhodococcus pyridinivorans]MCD5419302.1 helix-turn-helix domain-containing protein [Rhodococcus pyridinivorans]
MVGKKIELGPTGRTVATNIAAIRTHQNLTWTDVSRRLQERGREIPPVGIKRIEAMERRVDVDDLVAIAAALEVAPVALLMPRTRERDERSMITGETETHTNEELWHWFTGQLPLHTESEPVDIFWIGRSRPLWSHPRTIHTSEERTHGDD